MGSSRVSRLFLQIVLTIGLAAATQAAVGPASAALGQTDRQAGCENDAHGVGDFVAVEVECGQPGQAIPGEHDGLANDASSDTPVIEYRWVSACGSGSVSTPAEVVVDCAAARSCPDPAERLWRLWARTPGVGWTLLGSQCFGRPPAPGDTPQPPTIGPGDVLTALRRIGLPALEAKTQPEDKTLVNFETIFYAEPEPFTRTITLLGQRVEVEATPSTYTWHHGDGTTARTTTPGARYPSQEITHSYTDAHVTVEPRVDVTYTARFRVNAGAWQDIPETVTITGEPGSLRVAEATAVLSGSYR